MDQNLGKWTGTNQSPWLAQLPRLSVSVLDWAYILSAL